MFLTDLRRRVAIRIEERSGELWAYLGQELVPAVERLGSAASLVDIRWRVEGFLVVRRREGRVSTAQGRWYGGGRPTTRDSTRSISSRSEQVLRARGGRLGFNVTVLVETGE